MFRNRQSFATLGDHLIAMCRQTGESAVLIAFRLTNLATIDESFGFGEGDRASRELVGLLRTSFGEYEVIGRATIDTFVILIAGTSLHELDPSRARLKDLIAEYNDTRGTDYELDLRIENVTLDPARHASVEEMISEIEERIDNPRVLGTEDAQLVVLSGAAS